MRGNLAVLMLLVFTGLLSGCASSSGSKYSSDLSAAAKINLQLGVGYLRQRNYNVALDKLQKALEQDPDLAAAHNSIGVLYQILGDRKLAGEAFERALSIDPKDIDTVNNYARFLCISGRYDEAQPMFDRALSDTLYKSPEVSHTNAGVCLSSQQKMQKAEAHFLNALRSDPQYGPALLQMSQIRFRGGYYMSARAYLQRFTAVNQHTAESLWLGIRTE